MAQRDSTRWWSVRRARNLKAATYRCPLCGKYLAALSEHMLILPEGRAEGRRHAHLACVLAARRTGKLPTREEWRRRQPGAESHPGGLWARVRARLARDC